MVGHAKFGRRNREKRAFVGLSVSDKGSDIVMMEQRIGEDFWRRKAGILISQCMFYKWVCKTYGSSAIAAEENEICSK